MFGDYPFIMKGIAGDVIPAFTDEEKVMVKDSFDYIGINYYTSKYAIGLPINPDDVFTSYDQLQHVELTGNLSNYSNLNKLVIMPHMILI